MILFDRLACAAAIEGRRGGFRGWGPAGFRWWPPGWIPTGFRSPPGIHLRGPARRLILRRFRAIRGGLRPGWTPKNSALSLAILRASPASIRISPGRNRKLAVTGPRPDSGNQRGIYRGLSPAAPERTTPSISPWIPSEGRSVSPCDVSQETVSSIETLLTAC